MLTRVLVVDGRTSFHVPSGFRVILECRKFCNHVNKIILANLEDSSGVSTHIVQVLEDEWDILQGMICSERAGKYSSLISPPPDTTLTKPDDLDKFNALLVRLEIQIFYMIPPPGHNPESLKQNILRAYHTASSIIRNAQELDQKIEFLAHITYSQMRSLLTASCVIFKLLRSSYMQFLDRKFMEATASDAISICQRMSVAESDLSMRISILFKTFLELFQSSSWAATWQDEEPTASGFPHRLGAGVTYDCLVRWKADGAIKRALHQQQQQTPNPPTDGPGEETDTLLPSTVPDSLSIDWTFMDDFEWTWAPTTLNPPVNLWHGMAR